MPRSRRVRVVGYGIAVVGGGDVFAKSANLTASHRLYKRQSFGIASRRKQRNARKFTNGTTTRHCTSLPSCLHIRTPLVAGYRT